MEPADLLSHYLDHPLTLALENSASTDRMEAIGYRTAGSSHTAMLAAAAYLKTGKTQLLIAENKEQAAYLQNDLEKLLGKTPCYFYPASYRRPYEVEQIDNANVLLRAEVLNHLSNRRKAPLVITFTEALFEKVVTKKELETNTLKVHVGENLGIDFLNETLFEYQFERVDFVTSPGQFSIRGDPIKQGTR